MNNHTIFFDTQVNSWALMGDVDGWEMPLHYGSQLKEHNIVRPFNREVQLTNQKNHFSYWYISG